MHAWAGLLHRGPGQLLGLDFLRGVTDMLIIAHKCSNMLELLLDVSLDLADVVHGEPVPLVHRAKDLRM